MHLFMHKTKKIKNEKAVLTRFVSSALSIVGEVIRKNKNCMMVFI